MAALAAEIRRLRRIMGALQDEMEDIQQEMQVERAKISDIGGAHWRAGPRIFMQPNPAPMTPEHAAAIHGSEVLIHWWGGQLRTVNREYHAVEDQVNALVAQATGGAT